MNKNNNKKNINKSNIVKVVKVDNCIYFSDGSELFCYHDQECCEEHYLDFEHIKLEDFNGLEFDLTNENFFKRIDGFGIELIPIIGHSIKIPGYGYNNGYYSCNLKLVLKNNTQEFIYDITECQYMED